MRERWMRQPKIVRKDFVSFAPSYPAPVLVLFSPSSSFLNRSWAPQSSPQVVGEHSWLLRSGIREDPWSVKK